MANNKNKGSGMGVGMGAAVVGIAAAAAGAYFLYGAKDASKNRKLVRSWMLKARGEVLERMEKMKDDLTEDAYYKIVDAVVAKYGSVKSGSTAEADALGRELKGHWKNIKKHFTTVRPVNTTPKKATKKKRKSSRK